MKHVILSIIAIYQRTLSPDHGVLSRLFPYGACKFYPSCSHYCTHAISRYGIVKGIYISARRLARCHPWSRGGFDEVDAS